MPRWTAAMGFVGIGFFIGCCIVLGISGGLWMGNKFGNEALFVIAGLILGIVTAYYGVYQMLLPLLKNKQDKESK